MSLIRKPLKSEERQSDQIILVFLASFGRNVQSLAWGSLTLPHFVQQIAYFIKIYQP